jgi:hypothetical protein
MTREDIKKVLMMIPGFRPEQESVLETAVAEAVMWVWNAYDWSFKKSNTTFTTSAATYELPIAVDSIVEITAGTNNRVLLPLPTHRVSELYDDVERNGTPYYFSIYSRDADGVTIELIPNPESSETYKVRYLKSIDYGDMEQIPDKLHGLILQAARSYVISGGDIEGNLSVQSILRRHILSDKPATHKKWTMGLDGKIASRIDEGNMMRHGGSSGNTTEPYN